MPQVPPGRQTLVHGSGAFHCPLELHVCVLSLSLHSTVPGVQTPPHAVPVQTYVQLVDEPHCPLLPQVSCVLPDVHRVAPGVQTPPHAVPTQT